MKRLKLAVCFAFILTFGAFGLLRSTFVEGQASAPLLNTPIGLSATDNLYNDKVGLYWEPVFGATNYRLFRNTVDDQTSATDIGTTLANSFFDTSAPGGQTFFYWVRAENGSSL